MREQLDKVGSWKQFLDTPVDLDVGSLVPLEQREELDGLPSSAAVLGDRVPLIYEIEGDAGVVRLRLREKQAVRLRERDLPQTDRPLRFSVFRGQREVVRAASLEDLVEGLRALSAKRTERRGGPRRRGRRRRY